MPDATPTSAIRHRDLHHYTDPAEVRDSVALRQHLVTLRGPAGEWDVTDRLVRDIGTIASNTEEDFLVLTHGDVTLELDNSDGAVEAFFEGMGPDDVCELTIERHSGRRRNRWDTLFAGTLDLPWSLRFNRMSQTAHVQAYSYSKLLERESAETVRRTITGRTATVSAASATVTVSSTTDILPGDEIELADSTKSESKRVQQINSATQLVTVETFVNAFTSGSTLEVLTPYLRNKTPQFLAEQVFDAAGLIATLLDIDNNLGDFPFATPLSVDAWPLASGSPAAMRHLTIRGGQISALSDASPFHEWTMPTPAGAWTDTGLTLPLIDWTPYQDAEPGSLVAALASFDGSTDAADYAAGDSWEMLSGTPHDLSRNGVDQVTVEAVTNAAYSVEFVPEDGFPWVSQTHTAANTKTRYWDGAVLQTIEASIGGELRYLRRLGLVALHQRSPGASTFGSFTTSLRLYHPTTRTLVQTVTVPAGLQARTLRVTDRHITGLYVDGPRVRCRIWTRNWDQVADFLVSPTGGSVGTVRRLSVYTDSHRRELVIGCVGSTFIVIAPYYAGVVLYADFEGKSCAAAMKDLALITMSYLEVDENKVGTLRGRASEDAERKLQPVVVSRPLEMEEWPVFEFFRTSCLVTGRTEDGEDIEEVVGDTGDSARRLEIDSALITTPALAQTIGLQYVSFLGVPRRQAEIVIEESNDLIRPSEYIDLDGTLWLVVEASLDAKRREYRLRALEAA